MDYTKAQVMRLEKRLQHYRSISTALSKKVQTLQADLTSAQRRSDELDRKLQQAKLRAEKMAELVHVLNDQID